MIFCDNRTGLSRSILIKPSWLMIAFLEKRITCIGMITLIIRLLYNDFKIWKLTKSNWKLYVFAYVLIIIIVNIWIPLFIKWCNLYFLKDTLKKIPENTTISNEFLKLVMVTWSETCATFHNRVVPIFKLRFLRPNTHL